MEESARFCLIRDKQTAKVRFLMENWNDVYLTHIHEIETDVDENRRKIHRVKCLGDDCIACKQGKRIYTKIYVPLYNETLQKFQYWERSPASHFINFDNIFNAHMDIPYFRFEIKRIGHKGDLQTKYEITKIEETNDPLPGDKMPSLVGNFYGVVDESTMKQYLEKEDEIYKDRYMEGA